MNVLIIDDEQHCITTLTWALQQYCENIVILDVAKNGKEGFEKIKKLKPDLVFLDIEMPVLSGIDMLEKFDKIDFKIIFTTAYDQYAIKAIKLNASDYLLKPIDKDELIAAIDKVKNTGDTAMSHDKIQHLKHNLQVLTHLQKIAIPSSEGIMFFDLDTIVHLEASSNYTVIYFNTKSKIISSRTLKEYEDLLPNEMFFRCHHSHIINLKYIKKYIRGEGGFVDLGNGQVVEVSRRKKPEFLEFLKF
ncbi:MAG: response regulator transcription factor [Saprospiraceae bacterium]|nr:response regulator transcription factor [Saprospiraceae bacterium]